MRDLKITSLRERDLEEVRLFADRWIGESYFSQMELARILELSYFNGEGASLLAWAGDELAAIRLSFAPGAWTKEAQGLSPKLWRVDPAKAGYFKSLFVAEKFQQKGLGKKLSLMSMQALARMGAEAVVCHSWLESPNNSSQLYLKNLGFEEVKVHANFWSNKEYACSRCAPKRCACSAMEMIKLL